MLECNVMLTLFANYICLHAYIHFISLFNPNTKYREYVPYTANQPKIQRYEFLFILPSPTLKKRAFGIIWQPYGALAKSSFKSTQLNVSAVPYSHQ